MSKKTLLSKLFISFDDGFYIATNGHYKQCSFNAFEQYSYVIDIFVSCCCVPILITTPPPPLPHPARTSAERIHGAVRWAIISLLTWLVLSNMSLLASSAVRLLFCVIRSPICPSLCPSWSLLTFSACASVVISV